MAMTTITNQIAIIGKEVDDDGEIALLYKLSRDRQIGRRRDVRTRADFVTAVAIIALIMLAMIAG
jgi:hypothetical protein